MMLDVGAVSVDIGGGGSRKRTIAQPLLVGRQRDARRVAPDVDGPVRHQRPVVRRHVEHVDVSRNSAGGVKLLAVRADCYPIRGVVREAGFPAVDASVPDVVAPHRIAGVRVRQHRKGWKQDVLGGLKLLMGRCVHHVNAAKGRKSLPRIAPHGVAVVIHVDHVSDRHVRVHDQVHGKTHAGVDPRADRRREARAE